MSTRRYCRCGTPLAGDNTTRLCGVCQVTRQRDRAPDVPPEFWQTDVMAAALASGDLGRVVRAYRCHPFHGQRLSQAVLAGWLHMSQAAVYRLENGRRRLTIDEITQIAHALGLSVALRWSGQDEAGEDVDPLSRRSLLGAGVGAALSLSATTAPAAAREIDPELVEHWMKLLSLLRNHDAMCGPHDVLALVRREVNLIADHRQIARGELRAHLLRVESSWSEFASWLNHDVGDFRLRDAWADRALSLANEAGYQDMVACVLMRQSQWAIARLDARRAIPLAEAASRHTGTGAQVRALCALQEAQGHALADNEVACERSLAAAYELLDTDAADPWSDVVGQEITQPYVLADTARCWLSLRPRKAVSTFEDALRIWPRESPRGRGIHQAHLALACAAADEPERAAAEGIKALHIARSTKSDVTLRQLKRLDRQLAVCDLPQAADFREAFATL